MVSIAALGKLSSLCHVIYCFFIIPLSFAQFLISRY